MPVVPLADLDQSRIRLTIHGSLELYEDSFRNAPGQSSGDVRNHGPALFSRISASRSGHLNRDRSVLSFSLIEANPRNLRCC